jgi:transposase
MSRRKSDPLRPLTPEERRCLDQLARAQAERADRVARAKALRAVADGASYTEAAVLSGRRSGDGVGQLVARFNRHGLAALDRRSGGGPPVQYGPPERERILAEVQRAPDRAQDGTATWSLTTLQRALRHAPDGLPTVSPSTIFQTLHAAGYTVQANRGWCHTGTAQRKRRDGTVVPITDPLTTPKKT